MPVELSVGPPVITINQDVTFMVTDLKGEISQDCEQGIFSSDTRYGSHYRVYANDVPWTLLTSSAVAYNEARYYLTNQTIVTEEGEIPAGTLALTIRRVVVPSGILERLHVSNFNLGPVRFNLEQELRCDFADIFEVKWHTQVHRGNIDSTIILAQGQGAITYVKGDFRRSVVIYRLSSDTTPRFVSGRITHTISLPPGGSWQSTYRLDLVGGEIRHPIAATQSAIPTESEITRLQSESRNLATSLTSSNEDVSRAYRQSVEDMGALRLYAYDLGPDAWIPAAGVPWFVTLFGRDSLIVSLQNMPVDPRFARGALAALAYFQATIRDDWRDAQPGKILHEMRFGELAHFQKIPHTPYYGTWDATPFFLITLHEAWLWTGDDSLLRAYRDVAERCLDWIDRYGDLDGDGFQEYKTYSAKGYENMGWKDAGDALVYPDGSQVKQPKALCELQGYVFDAASYFVSYRLPELYAGVARESSTFPVQYLSANVPQAWAAGSIFHFLRAMLGLHAAAPSGQLAVDPHLPEWLPDVTLRGLKVGGSQFDVRFWREGAATRWEILSQTGAVKAVQRPWQPWQIGPQRKQVVR